MHWFFKQCFYFLEFLLDCGCFISSQMIYVFSMYKCLEAKIKRGICIVKFEK